jgi:hypothetical protein
MGMKWHNLLFLHWPIPADWLQPHIPAGLELQTYDGMAWIGVVPFRMTAVRPRLVPSLPWFSTFPELNVRTYVTAEHKPGVWFFSLDAANPFAVRVARTAFHLPYFDARMSLRQEGEAIHYSSTRTDRRVFPPQLSNEAVFIGRYRPTGPFYQSQTGSFESWLTERYCLYSADKNGRIWRSDIHHIPWSLQTAEVDIDVNTMTHPLGFDLPDTPPLAHYAHYLDVVAWLIHRVK